MSSNEYIYFISINFAIVMYIFSLFFILAGRKNKGIFLFIIGLLCHFVVSGI